MAHVHTVAYESGDGPDHAGRIQMTEHCTCGKVMGVYIDSVL